MKKKVKTWLPLFPGFYETDFSTNLAIEQIWNDAEAERDAQGLESIDEQMIEFDEEEYQKEVALHSIEYIENHFEQIELLIKFEKIIYPKEYNFRNDSIKVEMEFDLDKFKNLVYDHEVQLDMHIKEVYAHSVVYPNFPKNFKELEKHTNRFTEDLDGYLMGAILSMIITAQEDDDYTIERGYHDYVHEMVDPNDFCINYYAIRHDRVCPSCNEHLIRYSFEKRYLEIKNQYEKWWQETQKKPIPPFYSQQAWLKKINPQECYTCYMKKES